MNNQVQSALKALEEAKCLEQEGQTFYRNAAQKVENEKAREMFLSLAGDEAMHERLIQRQIDGLATEGRWIELPEAKGAKCDLSQDIFPQGRAGLQKALKADVTEAEVLIMALEFESKSYDKYRREAEAAPESAAREMYEFLASQERLHFDLLMTNYESMVRYGGWAD
ncbi:MAG: ferritin family protein [Anaerolineae bacterium]